MDTNVRLSKVIKNYCNCIPNFKKPNKDMKGVFKKTQIKPRDKKQCLHVAVWKNPPQYYKVISLQLK